MEDTAPKKAKGKGHRNGLAVTLYLDRCWSDYVLLCKGIGSSASARLSELMRQDLERLGGGENKEANKQKIIELQEMLVENRTKGKKLQGLLMQSGAFKDLKELVNGWGLNRETFANLRGVSRQLLEYQLKPKDRFGKSDILLFVSLLKLAQQRTELEGQLNSLLLSDTEDAQFPTNR